MTDTPQAYSAAAEIGQIRERRTWIQIAKIELKKAPYSAWFGLIVIAIYLFVAIFALCLHLMVRLRYFLHHLLLGVGILSLELIKLVEIYSLD